MTFQVSDDKGCNFLELLDNENNLLEPIYSKDGTWLKYFGHSNSLCSRATRAIINHAPISEYWLRFFPHKDFKCSCGTYPIKTRCHILHDIKITESRLSFFFFLSYFYFIFDLFFIFLFLEHLGLGLEVIGHTITIWWCGHNIDHGI